MLSSYFTPSLLCSSNNSLIWKQSGSDKLSESGIDRIADGRFGYFIYPIRFIINPAFIGGVKQTSKQGLDLVKVTELFLPLNYSYNITKHEL